MAELIVLFAIIIIAFIAVKTFSGIIGFLIMVGVWVAIGYVAGHLIRGRDYGVMGNMALGLVGGLVGSAILSLVGVSFGNIWIVSNIIVGVIGSVILIYGVRLLGDKDFAR